MAYRDRLGLANENRSVGRLGRKIRLPTGLRGRLLLAFAGISSFAVLSALTAFLAFFVARQALEEMATARAPLALGATDLLGHSERLVASGPALLSAVNANEVAAVMATKNAELAAVHNLLDQIRLADAQSPMVNEIATTIEGLAGNLDDIGIAATRRSQALSDRTALLRNVFGAARAFSRTWMTHFETVQKEITELERAGSTNQGNARQLNDLEQAMLSALPLDELQRRASDNFQILVGAAETDDPVELARLKAASQIAIRDMDALVSGVDLDTSTELLPQIKQLNDAALGAGGLFAVKELELNATAEGHRLIGDNARLANRLSDAVRAFVATSRRQMETSARNAVAVQTVGAAALALIALLSLISSVLIVWLYVGRSIVARLTRLGGAMTDIAAGGRETKVPVTGTDEVAAMGRAVEVFRRNAIELDKLLAERVEAAARLENVVKERTAELARREAELRVMFESLPEGIAMFDAGRNLVASNRHFQEILRLPKSIVGAGATFEGFLRFLTERGEFGAGDVEEMVHRRVESTTEAYHTERTRSDGTVVEVRRAPVPGGGFVSIYSDITERKRGEREIREARDTAEATLRELRATQASLIHAEKMASLGQLTAGIAHEIKNPLNFVNNFAGLSVELLDEFKQEAALVLAVLDQDKRHEIDETINMLAGNLQKITEHGRRADGIVKSMLLHSRGGTGDRQSVDLNALVEEALNLAYHGARAQDQNFNITLEREYAPALAPISLVPQDVTRVFLNLIGNGFYAANKRSRETGSRPILKVSTRDLGAAVEVRIRDNGTGIAPENRDKLFHPFFTTKPTGEGTGLGLSISYEIVTQLHGGTIEVDSEVGAFTEFTVRLPRK